MGGGEPSAGAADDAESDENFVGDGRKKHVTIVRPSGEREEHGGVFVKHSEMAFVVSTDTEFSDEATTRYEKSAVARVEVTQHHAACFITTAVGDSDALDDLRAFRDDVFATTSTGRVLLTAYDVISPPIARTLAHHPDATSTRLVRQLVGTCAMLARRRTRRTGPRAAGLSLLLVGLYLVGLLLGLGGHVAIRGRVRARKIAKGSRRA